MFGYTWWEMGIVPTHTHIMLNNNVRDIWVASQDSLQPLIKNSHWSFLEVYNANMTTGYTYHPLVHFPIEKAKESDYKEMKLLLFKKKLLRKVSFSLFLSHLYHNNNSNLFQVFTTVYQSNQTNRSFFLFFGENLTFIPTPKLVLKCKRISEFLCSW